LVSTHAPAAPVIAAASAPLRRLDSTVVIIGILSVAGALVRLPFVWTGISMDEGGYAYVAQRWAQGGDLYGSAWLDRPQGLLLVYRFLLGIDGSGWTIRAGAVLAGVAITALTGSIGWQLAGRRAGIAAAAVYAVAGLAPRLEGFTLNGELLASLPAAAAVACALRWRAIRAPGWLVAAGACAGMSLTMKPSGIDGIVVAATVVLVTERSWGAALLLAGFAVPLLACALDGWARGWSRYWTAIIGYHLAAMGSSASNTSTRLSDFLASAERVARDLVVPLVFAVAGLLASWRRRATLAIMLAWLAAGVIGVNLGGSYWPHYYLQLVPPTAVLAGIAVAAVRLPWLRAIALVAVLAPTAAWLVALAPMGQAERESTIPYYGLARRDERIAADVRATTCPGDPIFVLVSEANIYFLAHRDSPYPYLWGKPIEKIPGSLDRMRAVLGGPQRPVLVLLNSSPRSVDPSGRLSQVLGERYRPAGSLHGMPVLRSLATGATCGN
jgi:4-amino-4-deoxy-L-arabinose transferase-like glycosyltransferase